VADAIWRPRESLSVSFSTNRGSRDSLKLSAVMQSYF